MFTKSFREIFFELINDNISADSLHRALDFKTLEYNLYSKKKRKAFHLNLSRIFMNKKYYFRNIYVYV